MARRWVMRCNDCRAECTYAEIPAEGIWNYFLPKKPEIPEGLNIRARPAVTRMPTSGQTSYMKTMPPPPHPQLLSVVEPVLMGHVT
jgi:hypothetical protein